MQSNFKIIVSKKYNKNYKELVPWYIYEMTKGNKLYIGEGYTQGEAERNLQKSYDAEFYE